MVGTRLLSTTMLCGVDNVQSDLDPESVQLLAVGYQRLGQRQT
jgi:hypothetical protein